LEKVLYVQGSGSIAGCFRCANFEDIVPTSGLNHPVYVGHRKFLPMNDHRRLLDAENSAACEFDTKMKKLQFPDYEVCECSFRTYEDYQVNAYNAKSAGSSSVKNGVKDYWSFGKLPYTDCMLMCPYDSMHFIDNLMDHHLQLLKGEICSSANDRECELQLGRFKFFTARQAAAEESNNQQHSRKRRKTSNRGLFQNRPVWHLQPQYQQKIDRRAASIIWPKVSFKDEPIRKIFKKSKKLKSKEMEKLGTVLLKFLFRDVEPSGLKDYLFKLSDVLNMITQVFISKNDLEHIQECVVDFLVLKEGLFPVSFQRFSHHEMLHATRYYYMNLFAITIN
jgi:hypothetical protein